MHYGIPLTDPRYTEADEETILRDLLLIRTAQRNAQAHTGQAQADRLASQPGIEAHMEARKKAAMADPGLVDRLRAIGVRIGEAPAPKPKATTVTFRRKSGKAPVKP